jgi:primosomal protein N' (replication factor Y)
VEAGREGQVFTYANPEGLPINPGDLVEVRLQGRRQAGLVVACSGCLPTELEGKTILPVVRLLQAAAVEPAWQGLIAAVATQCHTSLFRTLRSALPSGWLGQRPQRGGAGRRVQVVVRTDESVPELRARQQALLEYLEAHAGRQLLRDLVQAGYGHRLIAGLETLLLIRRETVTLPRATPVPPGPLDPQPALPGASPSLTPAQAEAVAAVHVLCVCTIVGMHFAANGDATASSILAVRVGTSVLASLAHLAVLAHGRNRTCPGYV